MDRIDDGLPIRADVVDIVVEIENPSERLLRRRDVVAFRAEHHNRRADIPEVDRRSVRRLNSSGGEIIADEQFVDDELDFLRIQIDMAAPPLLESKIARSFRVDFRIEIVLLGPQRIGGVLIFEVLHKPGAIELAVAEIARKRGQPAAAQQSARITHRVLAVHACPI